MTSEYMNNNRNNIVNMCFDCSLVMSFKKKFFTGSIPPGIEDKLIQHLLNCKECNAAYIDYAKSIGIKNFRVDRYALKFYKSHSPEECPCVYKELMKIKDEKVAEALSQKWTRAAIDFNITQLMQMKAFRDLSMEYDSPTLMDYSDFYKFIAKKIAQKIDHLEVCLFKEYKKDSEKEKPKNEES